MAIQFREARKLNNLKLIEAADLLGVSQPILSAWEGGRKSPSLGSLEKMAELYGVSTDFLLPFRMHPSLDLFIYLKVAQFEYSILRFFSITPSSLCAKGITKDSSRKIILHFSKIQPAMHIIKHNAITI